MRTTRGSIDMRRKRVNGRSYEVFMAFRNGLLVVSIWLKVLRFE